MIIMEDLKLFTHKIVLYSIITFGSLLLVWFILSAITRKKSSFKLNENVRYVFVGSSHPECAYNDSIIEHSKNYSRSGEAYCYTYAKVKGILRDNKQIETIFVEFSNPFIYDDDEWLWSDKYLQYHYVTFSPFLTLSEQYYLFRKHISCFPRTYPFFVKNAVKKLLTNHLDYTNYGGHIESLNVIDTTYEQHLACAEEKNVQLYFLDKIVSFCQENNVKIVFVRSPLHKDYVYWQSEDEFQKIRKERYSEIPFWDFGNFLNNAQYFRDFQHVNKYGSDILSNYVDSILKINTYAF